MSRAEGVCSVTDTDGGGGGVAPAHYNGNHEKIYTQKIKNLIGGKSDELSSVDVILIYFLVYFRLT